MFKLNLEQKIIAAIALLAFIAIWAKPVMAQSVPAPGMPMIALQWDQDLRGLVYNDTDIGEDVFCAMSGALNGQCWKVSDITQLKDGVQITPTTPQKGLGTDISIIPTIDYVYYNSEDVVAAFFCPAEITFFITKCWRTEDILKVSEGKPYAFVEDITADDVFDTIKAPKEPETPKEPEKPSI